MAASLPAWNGRCLLLHVFGFLSRAQVGAEFLWIMIPEIYRNSALKCRNCRLLCCCLSAFFYCRCAGVIPKYLFDCIQVTRFGKGHGGEQFF